MPSWLSLSFQDTSSPSMQEIFCLHDHVIVIILIVIFLVSYIIFILLYSSFYYKYLTESTSIETIWSVIPAFLLLVLVIPSIKVLYLIEDVNYPEINVNIIAHQWYWSYISPLLKSLSFSLNSSKLEFYAYDSIIDSSNSQPRLLACTSSLLLPIGATTRFLITSSDVIHAFSVPSLGLNVDAVPGRINQLFTTPNRTGIYFGQCSEICGSNHSFIPIELNISSVSIYNNTSESYILSVLSTLD